MKLSVIIPARDQGRDAALAPGEDGGYVVIGLRKPRPELISGIEWSTPQIHRQTLEAARRAGLCVYETGLCYDVDEPEDLARLRQELTLNPVIASLTAEVIANLQR